jgi:hypothetical protein
MHYAFLRVMHYASPTDLCYLSCSGVNTREEYDIEISQVQIQLFWKFSLCPVAVGLQHPKWAPKLS